MRTLKDDGYDYDHTKPLTMENKPSYFGGHVYTCGHSRVCNDHVKVVNEPYKCFDCKDEESDARD